MGVGDSAESINMELPRQVFLMSGFWCACVNAQDDIKDVLQKGEDGASFHVSSCQFAVHYGFESEAQAHRLLDNACQHVRPGGVFIGTTPDADCLL